MPIKVDRLPSARMSRKTGRLDGREGLPEIQAEVPHSPFLQELATIGEQHFAKITEELNISIGKLASEQIKNKAKRSELIQSKTDTESEINKAEKLSKELDAEFAGNEDQSPASKVTDRRYLSGYLYYPIILITIIGELVITFPAFESIFQDNTEFAILTTFAASAMTVAYAYVLGLTLKRKDDKRRLLQRWVLPAVLSASVFFISLVAALSHLRAQNFSTSNDSAISDDGLLQDSSLSGSIDEGLNNDLVGLDESLPSNLEALNYDSVLSYGWAFFLFFALQMSLIAVATLGEYFHYSQLEVEKKKNLRLLKKLRKHRERLIGQIDKIEARLASAEGDLQQLRLQFAAEISNIKKKVEARTQAFWSANIRQRADSPNAKSRKFSAPEMIAPDWVEAL